MAGDCDVAQNTIKTKAVWSLQRVEAPQVPIGRSAAVAHLGCAARLAAPVAVRLAAGKQLFIYIYICFDKPETRLGLAPFIF